MSAVIISPAMGAVMGPVLPPDANDAVASASYRLSQSRSRLHQSVDKLTADPRTAPSLATGVINQWWEHHPLRLATNVSADAAKALVQPVAQRHPVALVAGAAAVGAILVWSKPWRWLLTPALMAGLLPKVISQVMTVRSSQVPARSPQVPATSSQVSARSPQVPARSPQATNRSPRA